MTPQQFKTWRKKMGLTQAQAAKALDLSKPTIENYDKGIRGNGEAFEIPHIVALACAALWHKIEPWDNHPEASGEMTTKRIKSDP